MEEFEFLVFMPEKFVAGEIVLLKKQLVATLFTVWAIYFAVACGFFCVFIGLIVSVISYQITEPIIKLNQKIQLHIISVQEFQGNTSGDLYEKNV